MTIALDATYSIGEHLSGVGIYSHEILFGLAAAHPEAKLRFYYRPHRYLRSFGQRLPSNVRRRILHDRFPLGHAQLFHGLNQRLPGRRARFAISTFHDLFVLTSEYSTPEFRLRFSEQARRAAAESTRIIAVSQFTAKQVTELLGVEPDRIRVVHHGVRQLALPRLKREPVVLHVGAIQVRKNIARLVEAFEKTDINWRLVLAGSFGYGAEQILRRIEASPARDRISVTGYISPQALAAWYARASIFAFPSLDEGFGMPVLEAMAAGLPVIASNTSAIPEVTGGAAMLIDPLDIDQLTTALRELTAQEEKRLEWAIRGARRAGAFTWAKAVGETWRIYEELLG